MDSIISKEENRHVIRCGITNSPESIEQNMERERKQMEHLV